MVKVSEGNMRKRDKAGKKISGVFVRKLQTRNKKEVREAMI